MPTILDTNELISLCWNTSNNQHELVNQSGKEIFEYTTCKDIAFVIIVVYFYSPCSSVYTHFHVKTSTCIGYDAPILSSCDRYRATEPGRNVELYFSPHYSHFKKNIICLHGIFVTVCHKTEYSIPLQHAGYCSTVNVIPLFFANQDLMILKRHFCDTYRVTALLRFLKAQPSLFLRRGHRFAAFKSINMLTVQVIKFTSYGFEVNTTLKADHVIHNNIRNMIIDNSPTYGEEVLVRYPVPKNYAFTNKLSIGAVSPTHQKFLDSHYLAVSFHLLPNMTRHSWMSISLNTILCRKDLAQQGMDLFHDNHLLKTRVSAYCCMFERKSQFTPIIFGMYRAYMARSNGYSIKVSSFRSMELQLLYGMTAWKERGIIITFADRNQQLPKNCLLGTFECHLMLGITGAVGNYSVEITSNNISQDIYIPIINHICDHERDPLGWQYLGSTFRVNEKEKCLNLLFSKTDAECSETSTYVIDYKSQSYTTVIRENNATHRKLYALHNYCEMRSLNQTKKEEFDILRIYECVQEMISWKDAKTLCNRIGMDLPSLNSKNDLYSLLNEENDFMKRLGDHPGASYNRLFGRIPYQSVAVYIGMDSKVH